MIADIISNVSWIIFPPEIPSSRRPTRIVVGGHHVRVAWLRWLFGGKLKNYACTPRLPLAAAICRWKIIWRACTRSRSCNCELWTFPARLEGSTSLASTSPRIPTIMRDFFFSFFHLTLNSLEDREHLYARFITYELRAGRVIVRAAWGTSFPSGCQILMRECKSRAKRNATYSSV